MVRTTCRCRHADLMVDRLHRQLRSFVRTEVLGGASRGKKRKARGSGAVLVVSEECTEFSALSGLYPTW